MRFHLFVHTALLFGIAQLVALVVADQLHALVFPTMRSANDAQSLFYFLIVFFAITIFLMILFQLYRGKLMYRILFAAVAFIGLLKVFEIVFPLELSIAVAVIFLLGLFLVPTVWAHDIIVIIAAAGIGPVFGLQFSVGASLILLGVLSVYDLIAVLMTKHMVHFAHEMIKHQASFALLVPEHYADFRAPLSRVLPGSGFLILGGGDVILPMFLTTSLYLMQPALAYGAIGGMLFGMFVNHVWLIERRSALPALPCITLGALLGIASAFLILGGVL